MEDYYTVICDNNKYRTRIEAHYIPLIERLAKDNWYRINNETHFIEDCFRKIRYAIRSFDVDRGDLDKRVKWLFYQSVRHYCGSRGKKRDALRLIGDISALGTLGNCMDSTEEKVIYNVVVKGEIHTKLCVKGIDFIVLDVMIHTVENYDKVTEAEISRALAKKTGRSFDSARGAVRGFKNRLRKRNIRREDIA